MPQAVTIRSTFLKETEVWSRGSQDGVQLSGAQVPDFPAPEAPFALRAMGCRVAQSDRGPAQCLARSAVFPLFLYSLPSHDLC